MDHRKILTTETLRSWTYVDDHSQSILKILMNGVNGETYNVKSIGKDSDTAYYVKDNDLINMIASGAGLDPKEIAVDVKKCEDPRALPFLDTSKLVDNLKFELRRTSIENDISNTMKWYRKELKKADE